MSRCVTGASLAALCLLAGVLLAVIATPAGAATRTLHFRDDLGRPIPGLQVCFWFGPRRRCRNVAPEEAIPWPDGATTFRAESPGHGPIRRSVGALPNGPGEVGLVLPRKAELTVEGLPHGARLAFYRPTDPVFREPLEGIRPVDPAAPVRVPSGATILAIRSGRHAPDLHRLNAPPGGRAAVRYRPRSGWSAVVRTTDAVRRRPVAGVGVRLMATSPVAPDGRAQLLAALPTGADGLVLFSGIEAPMATVTTQDPDHAPATARGLISPTGGLLLQDLALHPGGTLDVRVLWHGEPAADLDCTLLVNPERAAHQGLPDRTADRGRTDAAGRYRAEHLPVGSYVLRILPREGPGRALRVIVIEDLETTELVLDLHPRPIRGQVTRGGAPAPGYRVRARPVWRLRFDGPADDRRSGYSASTLTLADTATDDGGSFELTALSSGLYAVDLYAPDGTGIVSRGVRVDDRGGSTRFDLEAQAVTGKVVSKSGGVLPGAQVLLRWPLAAGPGDQIEKATANANGRFEVPVLRPGKGFVDAVLEGFEPARAEVAVGFPDLPSEAELVLRPLGSLHGRAVTGRDEPVPGVWVMACAEAPDRPRKCSGSTVTGADGRFTLPDPSSTRDDPAHKPSLRLWASGPGCPLEEIQVPVAAEGADGRIERAPVVVRCDTPPAALRIRLEHSVGHPAAGEPIDLRREGGRMIPSEVLNGYFEHLGVAHTTDARGRLLMILPPGTWEVFQALYVKPSTLGRHRPSGFLGSVTLDPRTVTDLALGASSR